MGLFSKKRREPRVHPEARRTIAVPAPIDAVAAQVEGYGSLHSEKHATRHQIDLIESVDGTVVELPSRIHPWTFHNLGFWLLDTPNGGHGTVLRSSATPDHPGYALVNDPELADCLCGMDDNGDGWTVSVPTNEIVRPTPVPATARPVLLSPLRDSRTIMILMEDPGHDLNPSNAPTAPSRRQLRDRTETYFELY